MNVFIPKSFLVTAPVKANDPDCWEACGEGDGNRPFLHI